MPFQPVPNTVKVAIAGEFQGETVINTLHFKAIVEVTSARMSALATAILDWWDSSALPLLPSAYQFLSVEVKNIEAPIAEAVLVTPLAPSYGTLAGDPSPNNVSLAIKFSCGLTGRSSRGRNYWPGFPEPLVTDNRVEATLANNIVVAYNYLVGVGVFEENWTWVVVSRQQAGVTLAEGLTYTITQASYTDLVVDSMRRRLPHRGV